MSKMMVVLLLVLSSQLHAETVKSEVSKGELENVLHGYKISIPPGFVATGFADEEATKSNLVDVRREGREADPLGLLSVISFWTTGKPNNFGKYNIQDILIDGKKYTLRAHVTDVTHRENPGPVKLVTWYLTFNCNDADLEMKIFEEHPISEIDSKTLRIKSQLPSPEALAIAKSFRCLKGSYWKKHKKSFYTD